MKLLRLNNKGVTLIELIVSLMLVTIVMGFLVKLLLDVTTRLNHATSYGQNITKRFVITNKIQKDLIEIDRLNITQINNDSDTLSFQLGNGIITLTEKTIKYDDANGETELWSLTDATFNYKRIPILIENIKDNYYSVILNIEVYSDEKNNVQGNNNIDDDINISYLGKLTNNDDNLTCLGEYCE